LTLLPLKLLHLSNNAISGTLPEKVDNWKLMYQLFLGCPTPDPPQTCNNITGTIPSSWGTLTKLQILDLSHNSLVGTIPNTFNGTNIQTFFAHQNKLSGSIPASLGEITSLQYLNLGYNNLSGSIPASLCDNKGFNYGMLTLYFNQLSGVLPDHCCCLKNRDFSNNAKLQCSSNNTQNCGCFVQGLNLCP